MYTSDIELQKKNTYIQSMGDKKFGKKLNMQKKNRDRCCEQGCWQDEWNIHGSVQNAFLSPVFSRYTSKAVGSPSLRWKKKFPHLQPFTPTTAATATSVHWLIKYQPSIESCLPIFYQFNCFSIAGSYSSLLPLLFVIAKLNCANGQDGKHCFLSAVLPFFHLAIVFLLNVSLFRRPFLQ